MLRNVRWSLVGIAALAVAGFLAGCSGKFFAEREPWRRDAEVACLNSGAVTEGADKVRIQPINGPGTCGADFPLKVAALGHIGALGFVDDPRPPLAIVSRAAPSLLPGFGPRRGQPVAGPVSVSPAATLACPVVSVLEKWIDESVQPAAMRWFGQPVVEIKQISAYSCRGMNGDPNARISEHAFGNALDVAAFILADGRKVAVKEGWTGAPQEQGFLRDVQGAACDRFTTVLAPGADAYHYDHIHVDLMRRSNGYRACNPHAVSGEAVAARAGYRPYAAKQGSDPLVTGSVTRPPAPAKRPASSAYPDGLPMRKLPRAVAGADGVD
jgi:hypothetical protein